MVQNTKPSFKSRRAREWEWRRQEILRAAERVFAARGFHGATMAEVAREAEFSVGMLYRYFSGKEDLYYTLMEERSRRLLAELQRAASGQGEPLARLEAVLRRLFAFFQEHSDFYRLYVRERDFFKPAMREDTGERAYRRYYRAFEALVGRLIEEGVRCGQLRALDPSELTHCLVGMVNSVVFHWLLEGGDRPLEERARFVWEVFLRGARR